MQKEQSLSTRMHSVQLFARDSTQRLSAREDQGIRDGENKESCGRKADPMEKWRFCLVRGNWLQNSSGVAWEGPQNWGDGK